MKRLRPQKIVIQERNLRTGLSYLVRYYANGTRVGKSFRTRSEAEVFASALETTQGMPLNTELTATSLLSAIQFQELCMKLGKSPEDGYKEATDYLLAKYNKDNEHAGITLSKAIGFFIASRLRQNCRESTMDEYFYHFSRLEKKFGKDYLLAMLDRETIQSLIDNCSTISAKEHLLIKIRTLLNYAVKERYIKENPAQYINLEKRMTDDKLPEVFTVEETKEIFRKVLKLDYATIAAYALLAFAGLRPEEVCSKAKSKRVIQWEDVDFEKREIVIQGATSKIRRMRVLSGLPDNLWTFLEMVPKEKRHGRVYHKSHSTYVRVRRKIVPKNSKDKFRHSFGSYAYHYMSPHHVIEIMGHIRDFSTFCTHYKGVARISDAKEYFAITPESLGF